jgi:anaerobic magnesium-protoporphyrin IX monomethyl ester cyclase
MTDILLAHSFFLHFDEKQEAAHMPYPPLGTLYAASRLRSSNITVKLFDAMLATSVGKVTSMIEQFKPKLFVIYDDDFNYLNKMCLTRMRDAAFAMSAIAKKYNLPVIVHGSDAADHAEKYFRHGADVVVIGEGEQTLLDVCRTFLHNQSNDFSSINGLTYVVEGRIVRTEQRSVLKSLDSLPFPAWDLVDWDKYRAIWIKHQGYFSVNMVTTRGCPYHCNWCAKPIYGQMYNSRSPENVVEEMIQLQSLIQPDHIWFADDIFGLKPGWVQRFSELVNERNIIIPFKIQSRADLLLRENEVTALASAGCSEVWIGAESGSQKILDAMEKGITLKQIYASRRLLKEHSIDAAFFLQLGYRGESEEDIKATIAMVTELMPENIGISISYPLPGTKFYDSVFAEMGEKKNWTDSDDLAMLYQGTFSPSDYKLLHRYVHKIFRMRQAFMFLSRIIRFQEQPTKKNLRRIAGLVWHIPMIIIDHLRLFKLGKKNNEPLPMEKQNMDAVSNAFTAQAPLFDEYEKHNLILKWMRGEVYRSIVKHLHPGDSIIDINAGTGIDAIHFALFGHPVFAIDVAKGMVAEMEKKVQVLNLSHRLQVWQSSYTDLKMVHPNKFHHVLSNFGGLNCVPDLTPIANQLKQLLHPNGFVTLVIMPAVCPWEILQALKGNFPLAFRRFRRNGTIAHIEGHHFLTYYHTPAKTVRSFGNEFKVVSLRGLASFSPLPSMETFPHRFPRLYKFLIMLDGWFASFPPFNRWADHYILTLQYIPELP